MVALDVLRPHRDAGTGHLVLSRPDVMAVMNRAYFLAEDHQFELWPSFARTVARILEALDDTGGLSADADPLSALLEPLYAHFVEPDLRLSDHECQCFIPHDPTCPDDARPLLLATGHIIHARRGESAGPSDSSPAPLAAFAHGLRSTWYEPDEILSALGLVGVLPAGRHRPRLWFYAPVTSPVGHRNLILDDEAASYQPKPDRRYGCGYRWEQTPPFLALGMCRIDQQSRTPVFPQ